MSGRCKIREEVTIRKMQFGFMKEKGTIDALYIVRQLQEKRLEGNGKMCYAFVDLEKAYDRMPRDVVYWALRCKGVSEPLIELVKEMYSGTSTRVNTMYGKTQD